MAPQKLRRISWRSENFGRFVNNKLPPRIDCCGGLGALQRCYIFPSLFAQTTTYSLALRLSSLCKQVVFPFLCANSDVLFARNGGDYNKGAVINKKGGVDYRKGVVYYIKGVDLPQIYRKSIAVPSQTHRRSIANL